MIGVRFNVKQFKLTMIIKGQPIEKISRNAYLTPEMKEMIKGARSGQKVFIENIKAVGPAGKNKIVGSNFFKNYIN